MNRLRLSRPGGTSSGGGWIWLIPLGVVGLIAFSGAVSTRLLLVAPLGLIVLIFAVTRPDRALLILIGLLPFSQLLLAKLYSWGVPASVVRPLSSWKEALAIGVVVAGILGFRRSRSRLDWLDWLALAFIAIAAVYALFPTLFAEAAPTDPEARSLAFRQTAGFVILFLGARHARLPPGFLSRAMRVAFVAGVVVASIAVYEYFFSFEWNDFIVNNVKYAYYQVQVLHVFPLNAFDYRVYGTIAGQEIIRVGSVFLSPLSCAFYLLISFAIGIERIVRAGLRPGPVACVFVIGAALVVTQTRSALIGALVIAALAFRFAPGRAGGRRIQFAAVLVVGLLVALPAASSTGLASRASTTKSSDDPSGADHLQQMGRGISSIVTEPLGRGLGTSAGTGQRFNSNPLISESNYIQEGNELGILGMLVFIGLTLGTLRTLRRAVISLRDPGTAAIWAAAVGLAVAAFFLHTWQEFAVSWTLWGLAGAAIGLADRERTEPRGRDPVAAPIRPGTERPPEPAAVAGRQ